MSNFIINNINIVYDARYWNPEESKSRRSKMTQASTIILLFLVAIFTVLINMMAYLVDFWLAMIIGLMVLLVCKITADSLIEYIIYGDTIVEYKALDWFNKSKEANLRARIDSHNVVIDIDNRDTKVLGDIFKEFDCAYRIYYGDRYDLKNLTPIRVTIDTTRQTIAEIYVEETKEKFT